MDERSLEILNGAKVGGFDGRDGREKELDESEGSDLEKRVELKGGECVISVEDWRLGGYVVMLARVVDMSVH